MKNHVLIVAVLLMIAGGFVVAQEWEYAALLVSDASEDETILHVEELKPLIEGRRILIETRDGLVRVERVAKHVYPGHILLDESLDQEILSGARIFQ